MIFSEILIEQDALNSPRAARILDRLPNVPRRTIHRYDDVFGRVNRPYLHKRQDLRLFVAVKRGQTVKPAPLAYGLRGDKHFYFVQAFNCFYECEYCYLQGYFRSPDLVFFVNHEDIVEEMARATAASAGHGVWFHAGEFSDSLALSHLTEELASFWPFFSRQPRARLELRTKSANIRALLDQQPLDNVFVSMSLAPRDKILRYEHKTARYEQRLQALRELQKRGFKIALHFDPIIDAPAVEAEYGELLADLSRSVDLTKVSYLSLGVVRFTKQVYTQVKVNYPTSSILDGSLKVSFDGKVRYAKPHRLWLLRTIQRLAVEAGVPAQATYLCMEDSAADDAGVTTPRMPSED
jgi:spore photoproduct lyase